jgi:hypothetical protein
MLVDIRTVNPTLKLTVYFYGSDRRSVDRVKLDPVITR